MAEDKTYIRRSANLDIVLRTKFGQGILISVEIFDKRGVQLDFFEFRFDEHTVRLWLKDMARKTITSMLRL